MAAGLWPQGGAALQNLAGVPAQKFAAPQLLDENQHAPAVGGPVPGRRGLWSGRHRTCGRGETDGLSRGAGCFFSRSAAVLPRFPQDLVPADAAKLQLNQMRGPGRSSNISTGV